MEKFGCWAHLIVLVLFDIYYSFQLDGLLIIISLFFKEAKSMDKLEIGDVVELRSGGPKMTIKWLEPSSIANCQWFVGVELREDNFSLASLQKVTEEDEK